MQITLDVTDTDVKYLQSLLSQRKGRQAQSLSRRISLARNSAHLSPSEILRCEKKLKKELISFGVPISKHDNFLTLRIKKAQCVQTVRGTENISKVF